MGATFGTKTGSWQGTVKTGIQVADKVAGEVAAKGFVWKRQKFISDRWRWGKGTVSFTSDAGDRLYGDDLNVTNGLDNTAAASTAGSPDYICTANDIISSPPGSGIWKETQIAEAYGVWEQWETSVSV